MLYDAGVCNDISMQEFFLGLLGAVLCFFMLKYVKSVHEMTGNFRWAENVFGMGGTIVALKLIAIFLMTVSVLYALHLL